MQMYIRKTRSNDCLAIPSSKVKAQNESNAVAAASRWAQAKALAIRPPPLIMQLNSDDSRSKQRRPLLLLTWVS